MSSEQSPKKTKSFGLWLMVIFLLVAAIYASLLAFNVINPNLSLISNSKESDLSEDLDESLGLQTDSITERMIDLGIKRIKPLDAYAAEVPETGKLLVIDLSDNSIVMYQDGQVIGNSKLKSQGKIGSFWQSPTGYYTITYTNPNHISSIGNVNMPYSLQYSGNFFIHGWPTYLDGTDVSEGYSGGCIRLETDEAAKVFDFMPSGSKVLVVNSDNLKSVDKITDHSQLTKKQVKSFPEFSARNFLVAHLPSGSILASSDQIDDRKFDFGSIGNFIMAITANEWISYATEVSQFSTNDSGQYYSDGTSLVPKALYPYLLDDNQAADEVNYALTKHRGEQFFEEKVLEKIAAIGLTETSLETQVGQTFEFSGTTKDLFHLLRYVHFQKGFLLESSNNVQQTDVTTTTYLNQRSDQGLVTGFTIYQKDPESDPYIIIFDQADNVDQTISELSNWLAELN